MVPTTFLSFLREEKKYKKKERKKKEKPAVDFIPHLTLPWKPLKINQTQEKLYKGIHQIEDVQEKNGHSLLRAFSLLKLMYESKFIIDG